MLNLCNSGIRKNSSAIVFKTYGKNPDLARAAVVAPFNALPFHVIDPRPSPQTLKVWIYVTALLIALQIFSVQEVDVVSDRFSRLFSLNLSPDGGDG
jgi:hypothetical protein